MNLCAPSLLCCSEKSWGRLLAWLGVFGFLLPSLAQGARSWSALEHIETLRAFENGAAWAEEGEDGAGEMAWQYAEWMEPGEESESADETGNDEWWPEVDFEAIAAEAQLGVHSSVQFSRAKANRCAYLAFRLKPYLLYQTLKIPFGQRESC